MLALRSLLNRPQPLFSCLGAVRRHASQPPAVLGKNLIGSRRYASSSSGDSHAEEIKAEDQAAAAKRHLYVVLDDHKDGYGVHKLDIDEDGTDLDGDVRRLTEPPVVRVRAAFPTVYHWVQFAAVGSSIVAVCTCRTGHELEKDNAVGVFIYDTKTGVQVFSPQFPKGFLGGWSGHHAAMAVGNRLYVIESKIGSSCSSVHCLTTDRGGEDDDKFWNWKPLSLSSPWPRDNQNPVSLSSPWPRDNQNPVSLSSPWFWSDNARLLELPFYARSIEAHAVVGTSPGAAPQEHEIFVSVGLTSPGYFWSRRYGGTFSFGTPRHKWTHRPDRVFPASCDKNITAGWTRLGGWFLPFTGHAHYDSKLGTWLGLHVMDGCWPFPDGYLCAGNVMSVPSDGKKKIGYLDQDASSEWKEWKIGKEKMCCLKEDAAAGWVHVNQKLVPMESTDEAGTEYCLMERQRPHDSFGDGDNCLLRLTTFHVTSGENGEPVATPSRPARSYKVSRHCAFFEPEAFWM